MREPGYYWVKFAIQSVWTVAFYSGMKFYMGSISREPTIINETRILNPDEVQYIAQSTE